AVDDVAHEISRSVAGDIAQECNNLAFMIRLLRQVPGFEERDEGLTRLFCQGGRKGGIDSLTIAAANRLQGLQERSGRSGVLLADIKHNEIPPALVEPRNL